MNTKSLINMSFSIEELTALLTSLRFATELDSCVYGIKKSEQNIETFYVLIDKIKKGMQK
jgi:hypothetical protein